jgi:nucleoside phosphorylase
MVSNRRDLEGIAAAMPASWAGRCRPLFNSHLHLPSAGPGACMVGPVMAAAYAVMLLETLAARGVRRVLYFGWCGALDGNIEIGDVVVPAGSVVDEGTSPAYGAGAGSRVAPTPGWQQTVHDAVTAIRDLAVHQAVVWTTDAVFRETPRRVAHFAEAHQARAVEMEVSALCSAADFLGVEMAAVLAVSDSLAGGQWRPGFSSPRFLQTRKALGAWIGGLLQAPDWTGV